ncbi:targeting protein for Xklp2 homolog isoform X2 [Mercenaria mercenaria]|uniref:targeting protein for Xklp2 homolog isoform X2 n=1 Tax=Mercenaria mercenaria TaxID=6596 RepID=UPI001E1DF279|nr:targeting protein for Xklp2 homolog isoform X2 [Mercenaria mercenaria]
MENDNGWDFNAPQYVDFSGAQVLDDDDNADEYFDYDHENGVPINIENDTNNGTIDGALFSDVFSTPQSEMRQTRASANAKNQAVSGTPKAGTPKRVVCSKSSGSGTPSVGTPQRVARSKSTTGTPQRVPMSKTPSGIANNVEDSASPELRRRPEQTVRVTKDEEKMQTPSPRVTRSGKMITPNTVEKHYEAIQKKKQPPNNICTNLEEWKKKTTGAKTTQNHKEASVKEEQAVKPVVKRQHRSLERSDSLPRRQKPVVPERGRTPNKHASGLTRSSSFSTINKQSSNDSARRKNHTRGLSGERPSQRTRSGSNSSETDRGITIPTTPTLLKRKPIKMQAQGAVKNSEQLEIEKISYFRQELAKKRKLAQESCKVALSAKAPACVVQTKELTKPEGFKFETDSRIKTHNMETRHDSDVKDFATSLRSDKGKQPNISSKHTITKPEPFKLSAQRKRKLPDLDEKQAEKYESMAERLAQFTKTPDRFRSKSKAGPSEQKRGRSKSPHGITVPKTPQFETRTRSRPVTAPTREDMEKIEVEEMQKNQFKAQPVNPKIFKNPNTGVRKVPTKAPTVPEEFHLSSKNRHHEKEKSEEQYHFHAQPLNKKILEGTVGVKEAKKLAPTVPESPAFALKHRARIPVVEQPKDDKPNLRSRPAPHFGIPFQPHFEHKATEPEPFGFDEREKKRAEEKKKKIDQVLDEEKKHREFHANPMPDLKPHLPPKRNRPLTVKQPFNLDTDNRGAKKAEEWSKKMHNELEHQKEMARFKAKNPTVLEHEPFIPHKENKYTTDISEFEFNTAKRMVKREAFEMHKKAKQDELDNIRIQEQRMKEAEERAEFERMRREAVHKANPVKQYRRMAIKPSEKPLTAPMSPHFQTDTRLRTKAMHGESFMSQ